MVVDVDEPIPGQVFTLRDCFYMLLRARGGDFDARVPLRVSASPIEPSLRCFFVQSSEESKKVSKGRTSPTEICVKYNNTARSRVWWSPEHNHCLGFVIRKMGTKVRLPKDQPAGDLKHGFQGHWLVLLERSDPGPLREKAVVRTFVIETAPSMVQLWPTAPTIEDDELASAANVMAYEIFKTVCDTFTPEEFTKWYQLYSQTIFIPRIAIELKRNMDRDDPRLRQSFMFASQMQFLPNVPKGILMYKGSYVKGFVTTKQDATATQIMDGLIMEGADARLYEETQASKIMLLCQHLHFKQLVTEGSLNPSDYWFHNILRLPTGRLMILRGHTWTVSRSEDIASEVRRCEMQDVTAAFPDIMRLPPLE
ncbi:Hypothetical Protein FCC1311_111782 [Hondaea fermentalgiana]|uniref:Uncharacterized protein n=1 Tax=Hondaea fermentalgiana TaxID=2315210 RepID=A0A2R5GWJ8_9STRA|nr:Hypothetical Protein FCC1311_111782 [Hondaea fermentalgiana]|eukprot:GBG34955.1 Hypothetical Protein FCC1311_111782 [Hondaea fermentalgiana]